MRNLFAAVLAFILLYASNDVVGVSRSISTKNGNLLGKVRANVQSLVAHKTQVTEGPFDSASPILDTITQLSGGSAIADPATRDFFLNRIRVRNNRMSLALGLTFNHPEVRGPLFAVKEVIARWFNIGLFIAKQQGLDWKNVIGDLFLLHDLDYHRTFGWTETEKRSGCFIVFEGTTLDHRIGQVLEVMVNGNLREVNHLAARVSSGCEAGSEDVPSDKDTGKWVRWCSRGILSAIHADAASEAPQWKRILSEGPYYFNYNFLQVQSKNLPAGTKTWFSPLRHKKTDEARAAMDKNRSSSSSPYGGFIFTSFNLIGLHLPPVSAREEYYLRYPNQYKIEGTPVIQSVNPRFGIPWRVGGRILTQSASTSFSQTASVDAPGVPGPAETTEELMQLTTFVNAKHDCFLSLYVRAFNLAYLVPYDHQAFDEILLGSLPFIEPEPYEPSEPSIYPDQVRRELSEEVFKHLGIPDTKATTKSGRECNLAPYDVNFPFNNLFDLPAFPASPSTDISFSILDAPFNITTKAGVSFISDLHWHNDLDFFGFMSDAEHFTSDESGMVPLVISLYQWLGDDDNWAAVDALPLAMTDELFLNNGVPVSNYKDLEQTWQSEVVMRLKGFCANNKDAPQCGIFLKMLDDINFFADNENLVIPNHNQKADFSIALPDALSQDYDRLVCHTPYTKLDMATHG